MLERQYQASLIKKLKVMFPGAIVIKNDPRYIQGLPDLLVLYGDRWAALEVKVSADSPEQANQRHYVEIMNEMSYAAFIYPEIEKDVLHEIQCAFGIRGSARVS